MLLEGKNLSFKYGKGDFLFKGIDIQIHSGERVGLVAQSGYGKSTLAKVLSGYEKPVEGKVLLDGQPIEKIGYNPVQLIYQHPEMAINPRWKMKDVLKEGGVIDETLIEALGIEKGWMHRYPRELSGGELQRFAVCRALGEGTQFIIADEISTMLDVITQAQIWNVIMQQARSRNLGLIVITHNKNLASKICTRIIELETLNIT